MNLKYIVTENGAFALFSETCSHADVAKGLWGRAESAGFCSIEIKYKKPSEYVIGEDGRYIAVRCYGNSSSLGIRSRESDSVLITEKINNRSL